MRAFGQDSELEFSTLEKRPSVLEVLRFLSDSLPEGSVAVVDHWEGDLIATGIARPTTPNRQPLHGITEMETVLIESRHGAAGNQTS